MVSIQYQTVKRVIKFSIIAFLIVWFGKWVLVKLANSDDVTIRKRLDSVNFLLENFKEKPKPEIYYSVYVPKGIFNTEEEKSNFDASLLRISSELLLYIYGQKLREIEQNINTNPVVIMAVMLPDLEPVNKWKLRKKKELIRRFPDELHINAAYPDSKDMTLALQKAYKKMRKEYKEKALEINLYSISDVYHIYEWHYEGYPSVEVQKRKKAEGVYRGKIYDPPETGELIRSLHDGRPISYLSGKYGQGLWKYGNKLGKDVISEKGNPDYPLWEYPNHFTIKNPVPLNFVYVPVKPEKPYQLYISCNGPRLDIKLLPSVSCSARSPYDDTFGYSFKLARKDLVRYHELNQIVKKLIASFIIKKGRFAEMVELRKEYENGEF